MTLLGLDGKPISEDEDCAWMAEALFHWLSNPRTQQVVMRQNVFPAHQLQKVLNGLVKGLRSGAKLSPAMLRPCLLRVLSNRVVRIRIAAQILEREYQNRRGYEVLVDDYPRVVSLWAKMKLLSCQDSTHDPGPRPELPEACPEPRNRKAVMQELLGIKTELEERMGSLVERPF
jgi:hypothetical protein